MAEGLAQVAHRVMVEATGRKPKTKPPVPNETAPQKSYPPRLKSPEYLRRKSAPRHARPDYLAAKGPLRPPSSTCLVIEEITKCQGGFFPRTR